MNTDNMYKFGMPGNDTAEDARDLFASLATNLSYMLPDGREKSMALTNLQQAWFWADHALTVNEVE